VVVFMLDCHRQEALHLELKPPAFRILGPDTHFFCSFDLLTGGGEAQAALLEED